MVTIFSSFIPTFFLTTTSKGVKGCKLCYNLTKSPTVNSVLNGTNLWHTDNWMLGFNWSVNRALIIL